MRDVPLPTLVAKALFLRQPTLKFAIITIVLMARASMCRHGLSPESAYLSHLSAWHLLTLGLRHSLRIEARVLAPQS